MALTIIFSVVISHHLCVSCHKRSECNEKSIQTTNIYLNLQVRKQSKTLKSLRGQLWRSPHDLYGVPTHPRLCTGQDSMDGALFEAPRICEHEMLFMTTLATDLVVSIGVFLGLTYLYMHMLFSWRLVRHTIRSRIPNHTCTLPVHQKTMLLSHENFYAETTLEDLTKR